MKLVVFDIDDTLTQTMDVDTECFLRTVDDLLDLDTSTLTWSDFPHVTDTGILEVLYEKSRGTPPTQREHDAFLDHFFQGLVAAHRRSPDRFRPVPGAVEILDHLRVSSDWAVALATGAWARTARFKLQAAGIDPSGLAFATSDDHHTRAGIVIRAIQEAERRARRVDGFAAVVAVGDGAWDVATAGELGISFIGLGPPDRLSAIGAPVGVTDFSDPDAFLSLLNRATAGS